MKWVILMMSLFASYGQSLSPKYLIKTAFIPQSPQKIWTEPWQDACEEAAILTVKYYYLDQNPSQNQLLFDYQQIFSLEHQNNWTSDQNIAQMRQISLQLYNFQSVVIDQPTVQEIKRYLSLNLPVIVPADGKILYLENKHFNGGGPWYHNLVILGYDDTSQQFIVHDVGTQFGAYFHYSYDLLIKSIHDFPSSGKKEDIQNGEKKVLVLLK